MTAIQIQNLDAQICMQRRGIAGVLTSFAYMHFRLIYNSVQIAGELGLKPPMVRIWAHRMQLLGRKSLKELLVSLQETDSVCSAAAELAEIAEHTKGPWRALRALRYNTAVFPTLCGTRATPLLKSEG